MKYFLAMVMAMATGYAILTLSATAAATSSEWLKLPYEKGQEFVAVQGYNSPPTHIKKDADALDLSQNGCDAFGKSAVAAAGGLVVAAEENGYNGGYGTQVLIDQGNHIMARYAHLIPGTIPFSTGVVVAQGQKIGAIGNSGLVAGAACLIHPGTHLHFALYFQNDDGGFSAYLPEPISGYEYLAEGNWYLSDNGIMTGVGDVLGASTGSVSMAAQSSTPSSLSVPILSPAPSSSISSSVSLKLLPSAIAIAPAGAVSATASPGPASTAPEATSSVNEPSSTPLAAASFNSSTLAIDIVWASSTASSVTYEIFKIDSSEASATSPIATTTETEFTYALAPEDFDGPVLFEIHAIDTAGNDSTVAFASTTAPAWFAAIQPVDAENSNGSWYDDNWYDLGTGFYGLVRSLTFEGSVDNSNYFASHLYLDEYLDPDYAQLNQTFTISNSAPFTDHPGRVTISGLSIPLQPNKYYRLRTYQDYQNRSVVLAGTSATGTAMWNAFIYGTGRVEHQYSFYPYLAAVMIPDYPPLASPNPPANATTSFDSLNLLLNFSWAPATDPDTTSSLLTYQWNLATSSDFDSAAWQSVGKNLAASAPIVYGNSYEIGIRAIDDFGNTGQPLMVSWHFPANYAPSPEQLDHSVGLPSGGAQMITFTATTTISAAGFWLGYGGGPYCCSESYLSIHRDASGTLGNIVASSSPVSFTYRAEPREWFYNFPNPITLSSGAYWFSINKGPDQWDDTSVSGSASDTFPGGGWSAAPNQDAYFRINESFAP